MNKDIIDWINKNLNKQDYFCVVQNPKKENEIWLVWKNDGQVFAYIDKEAVIQILEEFDELS